MSSSRGRPAVAAAGLALLGIAVAWRVYLRPARPPVEVEAPGADAAEAPAPVRPVGPPGPPPTVGGEPTSTSTAASPAPSADPPPLTPAGSARALEAVLKNEQTRTVFARLQSLGLSREQSDRALVILGTAALRSGRESPTVGVLRTDGRSRPLSAQEMQRVADERRRLAQQTLQSLRPALASVLTNAQLAQAGLGEAQVTSAAATH